MISIVVVALYKFVALGDYAALREPLLQTLFDNGAEGTLLLIEGGISGTVFGSREGIDALFIQLHNDPRLADIERKEPYRDGQSFYRTKVKLEKEIVTLDVPGINPNRQVGQYVEVKDWNAPVSDPEVLLIDTRNGYEVAIGTFEGAADPKTRSFHEFSRHIKAHYDPARHKKVTMLCTGGIRCEKTSGYMLGVGFEKVLHLRGGILKYFEEVPRGQNLWHGDYFVLDNHMTVRHDLNEGKYDQCHARRNPVSLEDRQSEHHVPGTSCPHCWNSLSEKTHAGAREWQEQIELARQRSQPYLLGHDLRQFTPKS